MHPMHPIHTRVGRQRGSTLIEALLAFLVVSVGTLSAARLQGHLHLEADVSRQRTEAVRIGEQELESMRAFTVVAAASGARSYAGIVSGSASIGAVAGTALNTTFRSTRSVTDAVDGRAREVSVRVAWDDRQGQAQSVSLDSVIAQSDPLQAGALGIGSAPVPRAAFARSAAIPVRARDLGDGRSAFKPARAGSIAYALDNTSGLVVAGCAVRGTTSTADLDAASLTGCRSMHALLLSGSVRFDATPALASTSTSTSTSASASGSAAAPATTDARNGLALALTIVLTLSGGTYAHAPICAADMLKGVIYASAGAARSDAVPIDALPASVGVADWVESGDRWVEYHCVVEPLASGAWSGRSALVASGWTIGTGPTDRRVCRFSADTDRSGAIDRNVEHPDRYVGVNTALTQQNFLVIAGTAACPGSDAAGASLASAAQANTVPHQP